MTPFGMTDPAQFRSPGPPALTSVEYASSFEDIKALGAIDSTVRTQEQTQIAQFWNDTTGTSPPSVQWLQIAQVYAENENLSLSDSARLFALLGIGTADAAISTWDSKAFYDAWRPRDAIRNADFDGNPLTVADPNWEPLNGIGKQGSSPEHTSGQSTFNGVGAAILAAVNGSERYDITFSLDTLGPEVSRSFESFSEIAAEAGRSRVYQGIHFEFSNQSGLALGDALGQYVVNTQLLPVSGFEA
jgi:PAP2 superfamily